MSYWRRIPRFLLLRAEPDEVCTLAQLRCLIDVQKCSEEMFLRYLSTSRLKDFSKSKAKLVEKYDEIASYDPDEFLSFWDIPYTNLAIEIGALGDIARASIIGKNIVDFALHGAVVYMHRDFIECFSSSRSVGTSDLLRCGTKHGDVPYLQFLHSQFHFQIHALEIEMNKSIENGRWDQVVWCLGQIHSAQYHPFMNHMMEPEVYDIIVGLLSGELQEWFIKVYSCCKGPPNV